jgi:undecaprenyl-phosphate 4-deoxy-4-formamido-L-arabinose transferase
MIAASVDVSVVIPVYRSGAVLSELVERLRVVLDRERLSYEIIFVDDASPDNSWDVLNELRAKFPDRLIAIQLMRNFGQHNALMCGFRHARGKYVITMDDDLQHPPEEIPKLLRAIDETGADLIYGVPDQRQHRPWRNVGSLIVTAFYRLVFHARVHPSAFRILRREVINAILTYSLNYTYIDGLLAWNTQRIGEVEVQHHPRAAGRSGYSARKLLVLAFNLFTNFSLVPLQAVSLAGFLAATGGLLAALFYFLRYLLAQIAVPGYASVIIAVLVLGGLQLLALGIHGEYLGRLHLNVNRKPQYTERQVLGQTRAAHTEKADSDSPA